MAFWLTPLAATTPLVPVFSIRSSPLFLGTLMGDPTHPTNWPLWGPLLSAMGVVFNGTLLGYAAELCLVLPFYLLLRYRGRVSADRMIVVYVIVGIAASQAVHMLQRFQQPGLRAFADSWFAVAMGGACGLAGGLFFVATASAEISTPRRIVSLIAPIALLAICAGTIIWSSNLWRAHGMPFPH